MLREYLNNLRQLNYSERTVERSRESVQDWAVYLKKTANKEILDARTRDLEQYVLMLKSRYAPRSINWAVTCLRSFYRYLKKEGIIFHSPTDFMSFYQKYSRLPKDIPNHDVIMKVLEHPHPKDVDGLRNRAILELLYSSALRNGEICNLRIQDLDLEKGIVFISEGKWRRQRLVPVGKRAIEALKKYLRQTRGKFTRPSYIEASGNAREDHLFLTIQGKPMTDPTVRYVVLKHRVATPETRKMTVHGLRHACATQMLRHGSNIKAIQELLGHSRISTTSIYTHLNTKDLERVQEKCHPRGTPLAKK